MPDVPEGELPLGDLDLIFRPTLDPGKDGYF
jgi:hypothetical protein